MITGKDSANKLFLGKGNYYLEIANSKIRSRKRSKNIENRNLLIYDRPFTELYSI